MVGVIWNWHQLQILLLFTECPCLGAVRLRRDGNRGENRLNFRSEVRTRFGLRLRYQERRN